MSNETKQAILEAQHTERPVVLVELSDAQVAVVAELGIADDLQVIADAALASVLKGKMQSAIDRAIKAKYLAEGKGKASLAAAMEEEIQRGLRLKREL